MKKNVTFKNVIWNLADVLYLPDDFDANKKYAALLIGGLTLQGSPAVVNAAAQHANITTVSQNQSTNEALLHMHQR